MKKQVLPEVGDVIMSKKFAGGEYRGDSKKVIDVDGDIRPHISSRYLSEDERVTMAAKTGKIPPKLVETDRSAYDPSRATAKFVVESAKFSGGSPPGTHDPFPDGWHIKARRLNKNGTYSPKGELICFYMTGSFIGLIEPKDVEIVGKMKVVVSKTTFIKEK